MIFEVADVNAEYGRLSHIAPRLLIAIATRQVESDDLSVDNTFLWHPHILHDNTYYFLRHANTRTHVQLRVQLSLSLEDSAVTLKGSQRKYFLRRC